MLNDNRAVAVQPIPACQNHWTEIITQVVQYFMENLHADLSVSVLAKRFSLEETVLLSAFESHTGIAVDQFVLRRRIERALHLLKRSNANDGEIAMCIGLRTAPAFRTAFLKCLGVSPTEYRRILAPKKEAVKLDGRKRPCKSVSLPVKKDGGEALCPLVI